MARYQRLSLPHFPLHIVQRGHARQPIFVELTDYEYYLFKIPTGAMFGLDFPEGPIECVCEL